MEHHEEHHDEQQMVLAANPSAEALSKVVVRFQATGERWKLVPAD